ncbi:MAG: hypothetical protein P5685_26265, partial [Limnospira sp. PMC 1261.20]
MSAQQVGYLKNPVLFDCTHFGSYSFEIDDNIHPMPFNFLSPITNQGLSAVNIVFVDPNTGIIYVNADIDSYMGYGYVLFE